MKMPMLKQLRQACREENGDSHSHARVSLIRNELAPLTGNHSHAVILNQLLYGTPRTKDFPLMLEEEKKRFGTKSDSLQYGWIYKTANDLVAETMLSIDRTTIYRYLHCLIAKGWIQTRVNPQSRWDRATQYRVSVKKIQEDLIALGHKLSELSFWGLEDALLRESQNSNVHYTCSNGQNALSSGHIAPSSEQLSPETAENYNGQNAHSNTENTTENTNRERRAGHAGTGAYACEEELDSSDREVTPPSVKIAALMVDLWRRYVNPKVISLADERKRRLESLLSHHFQADLRLWESFCLRVKATPFLMGKGKRNWQITLDWIPAKGNLSRVLEGNFDDLERIEYQKNEEFKGVQDREIRSLLDSIKDPLWKNWCSQLLGIDPLTGGLLMNGGQSIKAVLTVSELKEITQAQFMEFEGRLVWIECFDQKTLNKIEDLRFKFSPVVQATFPEARAIRGHLNLSFNQPQFPQQKGKNHAE